MLTSSTGRIVVGLTKCLVVIILATSLPLSAATFNVDRLDDANGSCDPGDCSLREALLAAEALPGPDIVLVPAGLHMLSIPPIGGGDLSRGDLNVILHEVEIIAPDGAVINAQGIDRVFHFRQSSGSRLVNLTITGGRVPSGTGGGIYGEGSDFDLENVWIVDNQAFLGGGMAISLGVVTVEGSTISGNSCERGGGGVYLFGISQFNVGRLELRNSTISGNHAEQVGGAIQRAAAGQLLMEYSTIVENTNRPGDDTIFTFLPSPITDAVYTLVEGTCSAGPETSCIYLSSAYEELAVSDLGLGSLANHGGLTPTHAALPGSSAIDVVPLAAACPPGDQRRAIRPIDGDLDGEARCDAGAYEYEGPSIVEIPTLGGVARTALIFLFACAGADVLRRKRTLLQ